MKLNYYFLIISYFTLYNYKNLILEELPMLLEQLLTKSIIKRQKDDFIIPESKYPLLMLNIVFIGSNYIYC